jgi:aspartyl-tRNA(Asn)/glutamyl-tRNA(Gln) amidotransferase subunit A
MAQQQLNSKTIKQCIDLIETKKISLEELYTDVNIAVDKKNKLLNVFLAKNTDALAQAKKRNSKSLKGIPFAVKDNFLTVGIETTASATLMKGFLPPYESTVTKRLMDNGAVIYGKTNMDAWAHGSSTETSDFGPTKNPWNTDHVPGGSSGGTAAAVASDMAIAGIGSETAGSIRVPAAWCGIVGLKPTYGRVPRTGVIAMGSSLDSPGPMTKTVEDAAILLGYIAGKDPYDATTSTLPVPDYTKSLKQGVKGYRIGIVYMDHPDLRNSDVSKSVEEAGKFFESEGAHVDVIPLSQTVKNDSILTPDFAISVYTVVQRGEVSSNLARYDGIRFGHDRSFFSSEAKRRIMLGTFTLSKGYADKYYIKAQQVRNLYIQNFRQLFSTYDILLSSPTPGVALKLGESEGNPMFGELVDVLNEPSSLSGLPGISIPCYWDKKTSLPLGLTIMADHFQEDKILRAAYLYEQKTDNNPWTRNNK